MHRVSTGESASTSTLTSAGRRRPNRASAKPADSVAVAGRALKRRGEPDRETLLAVASPKDRLGCLARAEPDADVPLALLLSNPHRFTAMAGHDQPKRRAQGAELRQPVQAETLDRRDQGAHTPGRIGQAKSSPLRSSKSPRSALCAIRSGGIVWASVCPELGVVGWRAAPLFVPAHRFRGRRVNDAPGSPADEVPLR